MPIRSEFSRLLELDAELAAAEDTRQKVLLYMQNAPCICFLKSASTGQYEFMNETGLKSIGKTNDEVLGKTDIDLFPEELASSMLKHDVKVLRGQERVVAIEARSYGSGPQRLYLVSKFLVNNGEKSIGGIAIEIPDTFKLEPIKGANDESYSR